MADSYVERYAGELQDLVTSAAVIDADHIALTVAVLRRLASMDCTYHDNDLEDIADELEGKHG